MVYGIWVRNLVSTETARRIEFLATTSHMVIVSGSEVHADPMTVRPM